MTDAELTAAATAAVEAELGRTLTDTEIAQAGQRVKGALVLIRARLGSDLSMIDQDVLAYVLSEVLLARLRNPEGYQSETIDDYTYRHGSETRYVSILPEWWSLLDPDASSGVFSARPSFERDTIDPSLDWS